MNFRKTILWSVALVALVSGCIEAPKKKDDRSLLPKVAFTFDDGFEEHYNLVAPILEKYGFRGTFNVIVDRVGSKGYMTWDQLRDLNRRGHAIENHTMSHPNLVTLSKANKMEDLKREIVLSAERIATEVGRRPTLLCHPYTATNRQVDEIIRAAWMVPMDTQRPNFGEGTVPGTEKGAGAYINRCMNNHRWCIDLLTHGVTKEGPGWRPFPSVDVFEQHVKEVRKLYDERVINVVLYRDAYR